MALPVLSSGQIHLQAAEAYWQASFLAMASPCSVLIDVDDRPQASAIAEGVAKIAWRIEKKFSRYRDDNIVHAINHAQHKVIEVDDETARLLDFADELHQLSGGLFDLTSGALRKVWSFDGGTEVPTQAAIESILPSIGWSEVIWKTPLFSMPATMQIDFGGIGKEYAVDLAAQFCREQTQASCLVNFGGDIAVSRPREGGRAWQVGVESSNEASHCQTRINLFRGGLATSGDSKRFVQTTTHRYTHILNPKTGWPIKGAPQSVTVLAENATTAGMLATLASLQGSKAESLLDAEGVRYWIQRDEASAAHT